MTKTITLLVLALFLNTNAQTGIITTFAGNGTAGFSGDGGQATTAEIDGPVNITIDASGNLFFTEQNDNRIRKISVAGIITTVAGNGTMGYSGDGGQATAAELSSPYGIISDANGTIYFSDQSNNRVRIINTLGIITTIAGNGTSGYSGDGGQATNAEIKPSNLAFDASGNLYIADAGNNRIRKINTLGIINTVVGNGTNGFSGDGGQATNAELASPTGIAVDAVGNLYIADQQNVRIRMVNTLGIISTIAGNGTQGFSGDGGQAATAELYFPGTVKFDGFNNLYITDAGNSSVRKINTSGIISTVAGNGSFGFSGDGGQATNAELKGPYGVAFDATGNLYIADYSNNRIRMVSNVANTTSISQISGLNSNISIYPNPNNGSFVIEPQNALYNVHCTVYDVNGKMVLSQTINPETSSGQAGKTNIDASSLNEGVYNISLQSNEGVLNKRVVIVK